MKSEAGGGMDLLIAERVMGWKGCRQGLRYGIHMMKGLPPGTATYKRIPKYSIKIADAFSIHERLGRLMRLEDFGPFGWRCELLGVQPGDEDVEAKADTAPMAICIAALLVIERRNKKETSHGV